MKMSDQTNELFTALSKFQGELENASKDKQGHGYKYADLAHCINAAKPFLAKHGLAVVQMLGMAENGAQTLVSVLTHASGQFISSEFKMVEAKLMGGAGSNPAQVLGSAITYQRRYAYAALIGLAQEDDDAASVSPKQANQNEQVNWYNGFNNDKAAMLNDIKQGKQPQQIIDELKQAGFAVSKKTAEQIIGLAK